MPTPPSRKLLVALDGSEQAMAAVEYVAAVFPREHTKIDLFHVSEQLSDLFEDMEANPLYKTKTNRLRVWINDQQKQTHAYLDSARESLLSAGFPDDQVATRIQPKKLGVVRDIQKASYDDYSAIVVGRTGLSRLKDMFLKSVAFQLVGKIHHLPVVVVGGQPRRRKLCIAYDGSPGSQRGVSWVSHLVGPSDCKVSLLSLISKRGHFWIDDEECFLESSGDEAFAQCCEKVEPCILEARDRLVEGGLAKENVSHDIQAIVDDERAPHIVQWASANDCDTIVVGRRGLVSFLDAFFVGRISDKVLDLADELAVWVI